MCCSLRCDSLPPMALLFKRLSPQAFAPIRATTLSAGYDLRSPCDLSIELGVRCQLWLDIAIKIPAGYYGRIAPCSGLACFNGIDIGGGVVDADYRGNIAVILINNGNEIFQVEKGMKIAQLIVEHCIMGDAIEANDLGETKRGMLGFGEATKRTAAAAFSGGDNADNLFNITRNIGDPFHAPFAKYQMLDEKRVVKIPLCNDDDDDEDDSDGDEGVSSAKRLCVDGTSFELPQPPESPYAGNDDDDDTIPASQLILTTSINETAELPNCKE